MVDRDVIAEAREKLASASPEPWDLDFHTHRERGCRCLPTCSNVATVYHIDTMIDCDEAPTVDGMECDRCDTSGFTYADADLIIWARNNLTTVLDRLESVEHRLSLASERLADDEAEEYPTVRTALVLMRDLRKILGPEKERTDDR